MESQLVIIISDTESDESKSENIEPEKSIDCIKKSRKVSVPRHESPFFCYLLSNARKNTYIGKTNDLHRRLRQHNGEICGGAKATAPEKKRPWHHVLYVKGFPDETQALSFEWHWRHPKKSRILGPISRKNKWVYGIHARVELAKALMERDKFKDMNLEIVYCDYI